MSERTTGPWAVNDHNEAGDLYVGVKGVEPGRPVAIIIPFPPHKQKANAELVAAAPELLEALRLARDNLPSQGNRYVKEQIDKAIDKAEE